MRQHHLNIIHKVFVELCALFSNKSIISVYFSVNISKVCLRCSECICQIPTVSYKTNNKMRQLTGHAQIDLFVNFVRKYFFTVTDEYITFPFKLFMFHSIICKYDDVIVMDVQTVRCFSGYKLTIVRHVCNCGFHSYVYCLAQYQNVCIISPLGSIHTKRRKKSFDVHRNYCGCSCWIISSLCKSDVFFA